MKNTLLVFGTLLMLAGGYFLVQSNIALGGGIFAAGLLTLAASRRRLGS